MDLEATARRIVAAVKSAFGEGVPGEDAQFITKRYREIKEASLEPIDVVQAVDQARIEFVVARLLEVQTAARLPCPACCGSGVSSAVVTEGPRVMSTYCGVCRTWRAEQGDAK